MHAAAHVVSLLAPAAVHHLTPYAAACRHAPWKKKCVTQTWSDARWVAGSCPVHGSQSFTSFCHNPSSLAATCHIHAVVLVLPTYVFVQHHMLLSHAPSLPPATKLFNPRSTSILTHPHVVIHPQCHVFWPCQKHMAGQHVANTIALSHPTTHPTTPLQTPMHVYEARCTHCYGTGWSRLPSNGRRGHLATCVVCHGLGEQTPPLPSSPLHSSSSVWCSMHSTRAQQPRRPGHLCGVPWTRTSTSTQRPALNQQQHAAHNSGQQQGTQMAAAF
jgi:hypothetical protein